MSICPVCHSNWAICVKNSLKNRTKIEEKKCLQITIKHFFPERCASIASKTEQSYVIQSSSKVACRKSMGLFFKYLSYVILTVEGQ